MTLVPQVSFGEEVPDENTSENVVNETIEDEVIDPENADTVGLNDNENNTESDTITGFDILDTYNYGFEGTPTEDQLASALPTELSVFLGSSTTPEQISVKWEAVEDYDNTEFYFYSMKPVWDDTYKLADNLDENLDVPWITIYREEEGSNELDKITDTNKLEEIDFNNSDETIVDQVGDTAWNIIDNLTDDCYAATSNADLVYNYLTKNLGLNKAAACGVMTNIYAESGMIPNNLENTYNTRYGLSDAEYTKRVDAGKGAYKSGSGESRNFKTDYCGYGLCQWTSLGRRTNLLNLALKKNVSIADINMQLEFLNTELQDYPSVYETLKHVPNNAAGAYIAATEFCLQFEVPANTVSTAASRGKTCLSGYWKTYNGSTVSASSSSFTSICGYSYPETVVKGKGVTVSGYAVSNFKISSVKGEILNSSGNSVYSKSLSPGTTAYSLYNLDNYMSFSKLGTGSYTYKLTVKDSNGKTVTASNKFTVVSSGTAVVKRGFASYAGTSDYSEPEKTETETQPTTPETPTEPAPVITKLKISNYNYPPSSLKKGKSFSIRGKVTSNYYLRYITVGIYDKSGKSVYKAVGDVKGKKKKTYYVVKLDSKIKFGKLAKGTYYYRVTAEDTRMTKNLVNKKFTVK